MIVFAFILIADISNFVWWTVLIVAGIGTVVGLWGWFYMRKAEAMMGMVDYADQSAMQYMPQYDMSQMQMPQMQQMPYPQQQQYLQQQYLQQQYQQ
jgi:hypothetical protein